MTDGELIVFATNALKRIDAEVSAHRRPVVLLRLLTTVRDRTIERTLTEEKERLAKALF